MARRNLLHRSRFEEFKTWLVLDGWTLDPTTEDYKILQARKAGRRHPLMVYDRNEGDHLSLLDRDLGVVRAFVRDSQRSRDEQ